MLRELRAMFAHTDLSQGMFHANHASNYLPIRARMPKDKEAVLAPDRPGPGRKGGPAAGMDERAVSHGPLASNADPLYQAGRLKPTPEPRPATTPKENARWKAGNP
jgi:hypothetical protein